MKRSFSSHNSDGILVQVYDIPMKYAKNFKLITGGGTHRYISTSAEQKEVLDEFGIDYQDPATVDPVADLTKKVSGLIDSIQEGGEKE